MDSDANSITIITSTDTKGVETENTAAVVTESDSSDTNGNEVITVLEGNKAAKCIGRSNKGISWGYCVEQGRRSTMEDAAAVHPGIMQVSCKDVGGCTAPECKYAMEKSPVHYFGIFDGHGGDQVTHLLTK
ncbi:hypothetical protein QQP08_018587 [Theobroma cacao]|nr:hypothetical protein QQP08_018587 [Theobroma cacao]